MATFHFVQFTIFVLLIQLTPSSVWNQLLHAYVHASPLMLHAGAVVYESHDHTDVNVDITGSALSTLNVPQSVHVNVFVSHVVPLK